MIPQTLLDSESRLLFIRIAAFEISVLSFRCITFGVDLCPKRLAVCLKSTDCFRLCRQLALCFCQVVQQQKTDAKVLVLSESIRALAIGRQEYTNSYLVMRLGLEPYMTVVDQGPKLRGRCTVLYNASNLGLVSTSFLGKFGIWTRSFWIGGCE
jgi:hypothetical protein